MNAFSRNALCALNSMFITATLLIQLYVRVDILFACAPYTFYLWKRIFYCLFCLRSDYQQGKVWDFYNRLTPFHFCTCLCRARTWIPIGVCSCHFMCNDVWWDLLITGSPTAIPLFMSFKNKQIMKSLDRFASTHKDLYNLTKKPTMTT
jgi:hypothetical protein